MCVRALTEPGDGVLIFHAGIRPVLRVHPRERAQRLSTSPLARDAQGRYTLNLADAEGKLAAARSEDGHDLLAA